MDFGEEERLDYISREDSTVKKPVRISAALIANRNLPPHVATGSHDKLIERLMKLTHVRLDRENISEIDNLEMLGPVTNLYLQSNTISVIENLESLHHLRFLTLTGNQIKKVENLTILTELKFLDLSENKIEDFDPSELPKQLLILNMKNNPCTWLPGYRAKCLQALPKLQQLDNINITKYERRDAGCVLSDSEDEDDDDDEEEEEEEEAEVDDGDWGENLDKKKGQSYSENDNIEDVFKMSTKMIQDSRARLKTYLAEHKVKEEELEEVRSQSRLTDTDSPRLTSSNLSRVSFDSECGTPTPR
ncbi:uncharacterized protein LOC144434696 [Glandiceps talaboti]